jgi:multiple sugar transport system substrate-binding protein
MKRSTEMKITKPIAFVSAITLAAGLSACASGGGATDGGGDTDGKDITLTIAGAQAPWSPAYEALIQAYQEETGVKVDLRPFPNDEVKTQQLNDAQSGSNTFDIYLINEVDVALYNANELLLPLTDIDADFTLDDEMFTYDSLPYWDSEKRTFSESGELTTVPLLGNLQIFIYRTDIYEDLGLEVPTTWAEVIRNGQEVQKAEAARYGYVTRYQGVPGAPQVTFDFMGVFYGEGGELFQDAGVDWTPTLDTPEGVRAAEIFRELALLGPADTKTVGQAAAIATMQAGDSAGLSVIAAAAASMNDEASSNVVGKVGFAVLPGGVPATGTWNLGIPADLPMNRRGPALDFIKWATSEQGMEVFAAAGGIPVRSDAFDAEGISDTSQAYLDVVAESAKNARGPLRLEFIGPFLTVTEPIIANIASGDVTPAEGMRQMQEGVLKVVEESGLPLGG